MKIPFCIGQVVRFKIAKEIEAVVSGIIIRTGMTYFLECSYFHNGEYKVKVVSPEEVRSDVECKTKVGFG